MKGLTKLITRAIGSISRRDKARLARELREVSHYLNRQVLNQIPGISAIAAILAGSWVGSTFTTSPVKGVLASWGIVKGGTHVVSSSTYGTLSVALPIASAALAAYAVQKALKAFRARQLKENMARVALMGKEAQDGLKEKLEILERAREAGIVSTEEYRTKRALLYQSTTRAVPSKLEEFIVRKLTS